MSSLINSINAILESGKVAITSIAGNWFVPTQRVETTKGQYSDKFENGIKQYHTNQLNVVVATSSLTPEMIASAILHGMSSERIGKLKKAYADVNNETVSLADNADYKLTNAKAFLDDKVKTFHSSQLGEEAVLLKFRVPLPVIGA